MDLLGKEGEKAQENVQKLVDEIERLDSHLNAVDSALQDFVERFRELESGEQRFLEDELEELEELADRSGELESMDDRLEKIEERQKEHSRKLDQLYDSGLVDTIEKLRDAARSSKKVATDVRSDLRELEDRVEELEGELVMEMNRRDFDFEQKMDKREFEDEKAAIVDEIRKLRASVNILADEMDEKDAIKTD